MDGFRGPFDKKGAVMVEFFLGGIILRFLRVYGGFSIKDIASLR